MKNIFSILFVLSVSINAISAEEMIIGDVNDFPDIKDEEFEKMNKALEYLNQKEQFIIVQKRVRDVMLEDKLNSPDKSRMDNSRDSRSSASSRSIPRSLRGKEQGDYFIDKNTNIVKKQQKPTAYVSSVSGMGDRLTAELIWGNGTSRIVSSGDSVFGGNWKVISVNRDDIIIGGNGRKFKIGTVPVDISSLMAE